MIVIAIIMILASLLLPALNSARERSISTQCLSNLRQVGLSFAEYGSSYHGYYPVRQGNSVDWGRVLLGEKELRYSNQTYNYHIKKKTHLYLYCPGKSYSQALKVAEYYGLPSITMTYGIKRELFYGNGYNTRTYEGKFGSSSDFYKEISLGERNGTYYRPDRMRNISQYCFLGDSINAGSQNLYPLSFWAYESTSKIGGIRLEHANGSNLLYLDGHAAHLPLQKLLGWRRENKISVGARIYDNSGNAYHTL